jgi:aspartate racemase
MRQHVGIVACSAPGAALCYETICAEAPALLGPHEHPEVSMHAFSLGEHVRLLEAGDWPAIARLLRRSAEKLAAIGADVLVYPDNTVHQALDHLDAPLPRPLLHIAAAVATEARRRGATRLGVLGTRYLMEGPVYPDVLRPSGLAWAVPPAPDRERLNRIIFDDLVYGRVTDDARRAIGRMIGALGRDAGCDAVVLGCTELPLVVTDGVSSLPVLDSTRLLARTAVARACGPADAQAPDGIATPVHQDPS